MAYDALFSHLSVLATFISANVFALLVSFCRGEEAGGTSVIWGQGAVVCGSACNKLSCQTIFGPPARK